MTRLIRATSLRKYSKCPAGFFADEKFRQENPNAPSNEYAELGTRFHSLIEDLIVNNRLNDDVYVIKCLDQLPLKSYYDASFRYIKRLRKLLEGHQIMIENTFVYSPLTGTADIIFFDHDTPDVIHIVDHKTVRKNKGLEYWVNDLQPKVYAGFVNQMFQEMNIPVREIHVHIGLVFFSKFIEWTWSAEEIKRNNIYIDLLVNQLEIDRSTLQPKRVYNDECAYCPAKDSCNVYNAIVTYQGRVFETAMKGEQTGMIEQQIEELQATLKTLNKEATDDL